MNPQQKAETLAAAQALLEQAGWSQAQFRDDGDLCVAGAMYGLFHPMTKRKGWHLRRASFVGDHATVSLTLYLPRRSPDKQVSITFGKREFALIKGWGYMAGE